MGESERIDYLIRLLSGNNAREFASKAKIRPECLSRARNGKMDSSFYFERILEAFPEVSRKWLYTGDGEPLVSMKEKGEVIKRIESLEKEVRRLARLVERMAK